MNRRWLTVMLLGVFVLSGLAGLIYQSIWSHYLGLTLGHAAYAQTLVLAIFMGGMALGAWLVSRYAERLRRLIFGYAVVELIIGFAGLFFHYVFVGYTDFSQQTALPWFGSWGGAWLWQWGTAAALIAPQTILLGATFPLMSAGLLRMRNSQDGEILGGLYFTNSLGAAIGVLLATFLLLPTIGMPGAMAVAGGLNVLVALIAWFISKNLDETNSLPLSKQPAEGHSKDSVDIGYLSKVMLTATFLSSAASFTYEIGWVRLLNQALGSTLHSFELMLAAFIAGLAFGGLWIRRRSHRIKDAVRYAGYVQVFMGIAALISVPLLTQSFHWVGWMMQALAKTENGYTLYVFGTALISLVIMFPAAFFAGMTLPLFTTALLRGGAGESAIGRIYAANTVGAILGVMLMVHVIIPLMGVRLGVTLAALTDALIGLYLLRFVASSTASTNASRLGYGIAGMATMAVCAFSLIYGAPDPRIQAAGVFRFGRVSLSPDTEVLYLRDGKTATIAATKVKEVRAIMTNGKPDASMTPADLPPPSDEVTMIMAAALPLATHPKPERIAVIGWGSGLTTHTLLGSDIPKQVDTIEIERAMWEGAKVFGTRVERAYKDPRSNAIFDDARTYFAAGRRKYDVVISEPSNPWVSGVASLFTEEFYRFLHGHLNDDGQLVQWIQLYEIDDAIVSTMMSALIKVFPDVELYITNTSDLLILAKKTPAGTVYRDSIWSTNILAKELKRVGLGNTDELKLRRLASAAVLRTFLRAYPSLPHSDYYPTVSLRGPETRYRQASASFLTSLPLTGLPLHEVLDGQPNLADTARIDFTNTSHLSQSTYRARKVRDVLLDRTSINEVKIFPPIVSNALHMIDGLKSNPEAVAAYSQNLSIIGSETLGFLPKIDAIEVWQNTAWNGYSEQMPVILQKLIAAYRATAARDVPAMRTTAQTVLEDKQNDQLAAEARGDMLVIAMLAAAAQGDCAAVSKFEKDYGDKVPANILGSTRSFLMAWVDGEANCRL